MIFLRIPERRIGRVNIAIIFPHSVRGQVVQQIDDLNGIVRNRDVLVKGASFVFQFQPTSIAKPPDQQMRLARQPLAASDRHAHLFLFFRKVRIQHTRLQRIHQHGDEILPPDDQFRLKSLPENKKRLHIQFFLG